MNLKNLVLALLALVAINEGAQAQAFSDGTNLVMFGFGLPPGESITKEYNQYENFTDYKLKNYGTLVLKFEHGMHENFGVGLNAEYSGASVSFLYDSDSTLSYRSNIKNHTMGAFFRMNGHYSIIDNLDLYGGVGLGYLFQIENTEDTNPISEDNVHKRREFGFDYQFTVGARYMIKDTFGLFVEVGRATTKSQIGVVTKFLTYLLMTLNVRDWANSTAWTRTKYNPGPA